MQDALFETMAWLKHMLRAGNKHSVHSPMVFKLLTQVLGGKKKFYCFQEIENERSLLLKDQSIVQINDLGAGSRNANRTIAQIAKSALQKPRYAQALFQMVHYYQSQSILELGTSLGLTTAYLAKANPNSTVFSIEGAESIAQRANSLHDKLGLKNIHVVVGNFDDVLDSVLKRMSKPDFVLIDGNHRYEPTVRYFKQIMECCHPQSIIVLDDIHWSSEMTRAWRDINALDRVRVSIDFFHFGLIFFKEGVAKQHFVLKLP